MALLRVIFGFTVLPIICAAFFTLLNWFRSIVIPIHNISCYFVKCGRVFKSTTYSITIDAQTQKLLL